MVSQHTAANSDHFNAVSNSQAAPSPLEGGVHLPAGTDWALPNEDLIYSAICRGSHSPTPARHLAQVSPAVQGRQAHGIPSPTPPKAQHSGDLYYPASKWQTKWQPLLHHTVSVRNQVFPYIMLKNKLPSLPETTQPVTESSKVISVLYHRYNRSQGQGAWFPCKSTFRKSTSSHKPAHSPPLHEVQNMPHWSPSVQENVLAFSWKQGEGQWQEKKKAPPVKTKGRKGLPPSPQGSRGTNHNSACTPALPMLGSEGKEAQYSRMWRAKPKFPAKYCCQTRHFLSVFVKQIEPVL